MKEENKIAIGNPNDWHIEVYPKSAGDFGFCSHSGIKYDEKEALSLFSDMSKEIERHINRVRCCSMVYDSFICSKCNSIFETEEQAKNCDC